MGPLTPTTLFDDTDISTCPGRPLPLVLDLTCYKFLRFLGLPISQVGHSGPLSPCPPLPPIILPSTCSQTVIPLLSCHLVHKSTHLLPFCTPPLSASLSLHFRIFGTIYGCPMLLMPLPTLIHHIRLFFHTLHLLLEPSHSLAPACLLPTHFCILIHFWMFFCVHFNYDPCKYVIASIE